MTKSLLNQRYIPLRKLGAGGMGEVYLAHQTGEAGFRREVALKRIHRRFSDHHGAVYLFLQEARVAAALSHPNVVQIFDVGQEEDGSFFIVMENVRGTDLRNLAEMATRRGHMIPMDISLGLVAQLLEGLRYAHTYRDGEGRSMGVVHGDIGPNNILISVDGVVKLVDFGLAGAEGRMRQEGALHAGKFAYMSPEVVNGLAKDARSDLFSVGILLYELTVGQRLFRVNSYESLRRVLSGPITPPSQIRPGYPADLEAVVMRALEIRPELRFSSAASMLEDLEDFAFAFGLRMSRLRLGRYTRQMLGMVDPYDALEGAAPAPDQSPEPADELDFDKAAGATAGPEPEVEEAFAEAREAAAALEAERTPVPADEEPAGAVPGRKPQESVDLWGEALEDVTDIDAEGTDPTISLEDRELEPVADEEAAGGEAPAGRIESSIPAPEDLVGQMEEGAEAEEEEEEDEIFPDDLLQDYLDVVGEQEEEGELEEEDDDDEEDVEEDLDAEDDDELYDDDDDDDDDDDEPGVMEESGIVVTDDLVEEELDEEEEEELLVEGVIGGDAEEAFPDEPSADVRVAMDELADELGLSRHSSWDDAKEGDTSEQPAVDFEPDEESADEDPPERELTLEDLKVSWDDDEDTPVEPGAQDDEEDADDEAGEAAEDVDEDRDEAPAAEDREEAASSEAPAMACTVARPAPSTTRRRKPAPRRRKIKARAGTRRVLRRRKPRAARPARQRRRP